MNDHVHSFTCLEEVGGHLVCRTQAKQLTVKDLPAESLASRVLASPTARRPSILNPRKNKKVTQGHSSLDEPRSRFNWGYHDGANDAKASREPTWKSPHYDPVYEAGYRKGRSHVEVSETYTGDSTAAWEEYTHGRTILTGKGSLQTTFYLKPGRYDARGASYEAHLDAYKRWMDLVKIGDLPREAVRIVETETGQQLTAITTSITNAVQKAQLMAGDALHLVLVAESPTGKNTKNVYEVKGILR